MLSRRALLLSAAALLAAGAARATEAAEPLAIVREIYRLAMKEEADFTLTHEGRQKYLSKSLVDLWLRAEKNTPEGDVLIDSDPISNSQDPDIASFTVKQERRSADRATVAATFTEHRTRKFAQDLTVRYDFVREGGRWMIDDIRGTVDGKPWSIRANLEHSLKF
jgi:hypothetical protein